MLFKYSLPGSTVLACALAFGLGGCVALPLAQVGVVQAAPEKVPCSPGPGCRTEEAANSFGDMSKSISNAFHKPGSVPPDVQSADAGTPAQ
jgi:hypothetical protein